MPKWQDFDILFWPKHITQLTISVAIISACFRKALTILLTRQARNIRVGFFFDLNFENFFISNFTNNVLFVSYNDEHLHIN